MSLVQVLPSGDGWSVRAEGQESRSFPTQAEAEQEGRRIARETGAEFQLHSADGTIREKDSYGNDPSHIKG